MEGSARCCTIANCNLKESLCQLGRAASSTRRTARFPINPGLGPSRNTSKPISITPPNRSTWIHRETLFPHGPVRAPLWTGFEIQQYPGYVVIIQDQNHTFRVIPLDGRPHPSQALKLWMGNSRGHWEGATLVVDVQNENSKGRLDNIGDFSSDKVHIVERYTFNNPNSFDYRATFEDPSVYTRPWTLYAKYVRQHADEPGYEPWENACQEGEKNSSESLLSDNAAKPAGPAS